MSTLGPNQRAQAAMEFLMTYGWVLLILVIAGAAMYAMGIMNRGTYQNTGCVGFVHLHYQDHLFRRTGQDDLWDVGDDLMESRFRLALQNGAGVLVQVTGIDVEYPKEVHVTWSERGYDCEAYNTANDTDSGCNHQNVTEGEITLLSMEDVGYGMKKLEVGEPYALTVKISYNAFGALAGHTEMALCSGKVEGTSNV